MKKLKLAKDGIHEIITPNGIFEEAIEHNELKYYNLQDKRDIQFRNDILQELKEFFKKHNKEVKRWEKR